MKKRWLAGRMTYQYKKLPVTMKKWMQFKVMPRTYHLKVKNQIRREFFMREGVKLGVNFGIAGIGQENRTDLP